MIEAKRHTVFTTYTDSMMYGFYLANAKSFSQMIACGAAVLRVTRLLLSWLVRQFKMELNDDLLQLSGRQRASSYHRSVVFYRLRNGHSGATTKPYPLIVPPVYRFVFHPCPRNEWNHSCCQCDITYVVQVQPLKV